jgi:hypothetical protein
MADKSGHTDYVEGLLRKMAQNLPTGSRTIQKRGSHPFAVAQIQRFQLEPRTAAKTAFVLSQ